MGCDGVHPSHLPQPVIATAVRTEQRHPMINVQRTAVYRQAFPMITLAFLSVLLPHWDAGLLLDVQSDAAFVPALLSASLHWNVHQVQASRAILMVFLGIHVYHH